MAYFVKTFDTVDHDILDCALRGLGLPAWFRRVYFSFHKEEIRLRFKLASKLGDAWTRDGSTPQGCPLRMALSVALRVPWCRHLESLRRITPQFFDNNLTCSVWNVDDLRASPQCTVSYVQVVGHDISPGKCVLLHFYVCSQTYECLESFLEQILADETLSGLQA